MGNVGSGKSTILSAILAELNKKKGSISVSSLEEGFGFVSQQPWLQRGSIRNNILFGKAYDDSRYKLVLEVCCLNKDLSLLPGGDLTGVGEGGMTLSGGQKARIALARAIYQDKNIYLLDDILSAVDVKVAKHIFQFCIMGFLKNKARILCTHHVQYLVHADRIVVLDNGRIKRQGKPSNVLQDIDHLIPIDLELGDSTQSTSTIFENSLQSEKSKDEDSIFNEETQEVGGVEFSVYKTYWRAIGYLLSLCIILSMISMQTSRNMTDWWLSYWVGNMGGNSTNRSNVGLILESLDKLFLNGVDQHGMKYYMSIYGVLAGLNTVFTLFRAFLFAYGGVAAASKIHRMLLKSVVKSKVTFFDITPLGRILNRFSSDTYTVDDSLPFIMNILLAQIFGLLGKFSVVFFTLLLKLNIFL